MTEQRAEMSKEKRELQKILQHFNIYPDNPMNVLTQEDSKKFINGKEGDKYEFFLKASGLRKVKEELLVAKQEIDESRRNITSIEGRLDIKKANKDKLKVELEQFQRLGLISAKIEMANAKLLWIPYYKQGICDLTKLIEKFDLQEW
jgi:chromosome segregation ATPase